MTARKCKKQKMQADFFAFLNVYMTLKPIKSKLPTLLIDSSRPYKKTIRKSKNRRL